jgi:mitochondrial transcription factor 1
MGYAYVHPCLKPEKTNTLAPFVVHPELHFVTHIPQTISGEQLVAQLFRCIPEKSWLFKHGRIPMSFILADWVWRVGIISFSIPLCRPSHFPEDLRATQRRRTL